jgi:hypothetical protein
MSGWMGDGTRIKTEKSDVNGLSVAIRSFRGHPRVIQSSVLSNPQSNAL